MVPFSRSMTCAAIAGSSASAATPARSRRDSDGVPKADARASASRVSGGRPEILARTSSSSVSGTGRGSRGIDVLIENSCHLEREEGITARPLMDTDQCLTRKGPSQPVAQKSMKCPDAQGRHRHPLYALLTKRHLEAQRLHPVGESPGEQQQHVVPLESSQRERKRARRRRVEPLDVVDGNQNRLSDRSETAARRALQRQGRGDRQGLPTPPLEGARPRARSASALTVQTSTSSMTSSSRSPSPTRPRPRSASAGREERTLKPCARACSTPASQSVDFPIPASPSSTRAAGPPSASPMKALTEANSASRPTISKATLQRW